MNFIACDYVVYKDFVAHNISDQSSDSKVKIEIFRASQNFRIESMQEYLLVI